MFVLKGKKNVLLSIICMLSLMLSLALLAGCGEEKTKAETGSVTLEYATKFKIENLADNCKKVTDGEGRELLLVPRGQEAPSEYKDKDLPVINTPVKRVVALSTTQASLLRPLDELGSIVAATTAEESWFMDEMKEGLKSGKIELVGSGMGPLDFDKIVALKPDIVFLNTGSAADTESLRKLEELKVPVAVDNAWLENDPLGRMEWVKFLAAFYEKGDKADQVFQNTVNKTEEITKKVASAKTKPKVLWGMIYQGKVYVPDGDSYAAKMIEMAGGDYLFTDKKGGGEITLEEYYARGKEADIYMSDTLPQYGVSSIAKITEQGKVLADLKTVKEGKVWCYQPWYYESLDKTDEIIADLGAIFHPELFPDAELKQFKQLPKTD